MTVVVTTKTPWPAFPAYMYGSGRFGIMAQAQLDDPATCDTKLIGTGPFKLKEWQINDHLTAEKNPDYWMKDGDGKQLPVPRRDHLQADPGRPRPLDRAPVG